MMMGTFVIKNKKDKYNPYSLNFDILYFKLLFLLHYIYHSNY